MARHLLTRDPLATWPFPEGAHHIGPGNSGRQCTQLRDLEPRQCAERRCAAAGVCKHQQENHHVPVPTQGPILDSGPATKQTDHDDIGVEEQLEIIEYVEQNSPVFQGMVDATMSAMRVFHQLLQGTVDPVMVRVLLDELSAISVASDELFEDIYELAHPEEEEEQETELTGPEECGRGLSMAKCIQSTCNANCEIPQRK